MHNSGSSPTSSRSKVTYLHVVRLGNAKCNIFGVNILGNALTNEEVQKRLDEGFAQKVTLLSNYISRREKITLKCEDCGNIWDTLAQSVIYNKYKHYCPNCGITKRINLKCSYCGKEIQRRPSDIKSNKSGYFYCSRECGNLHKNQLRLESGEWKNSNNYRKKAFDNYEHKCAVCGWNEDERVLEVHHIDENREHNNLENLCILCPICHKKITLHLYQLTEDFQLKENTNEVNNNN